MASDGYVSVTGPALSLLIYENIKSMGDQEGLLLGEVIEHVTRTISDSHIQNEKSETIISINSLIPFPTSCQFYNGVGRINNEVRDSLVTNYKEVVGWYSFRRFTSFVPHLRDKLFHKELIASLTHMQSDHVIMCLLNSSVSKTNSTHIFNHKFIRYRFKKFEPIVMQIHNLGETHQSEYKVNPSITSLSSSFNQIVKSALEANKDASDKSDANLVCHIQKALQDHLRKLINDVSVSEENILQLEREVETLRQHKGPLSNEKLLPKLLQDDYRPSICTPEIDSPSSSKKTVHNNQDEKSVGDVIISQTPPSLGLGNQDISKESENSSTSDGTATQGLFAYVTTEMNQMSQKSPPKKSIQSPDATNNSPSRRGRSATKNSTRGARVGAPQSGKETFPNLQQVQSSGHKSPQTKSPQATTRAGYAQAVKKPNSASEDVNTTGRKPVTRSQATISNGSEPKQNQ